LAEKTTIDIGRLRMVPQAGWAASNFDASIRGAPLAGWQFGKEWQSGQSPKGVENAWGALIT